jgi:plasmid maintenance system antidote protein VapI
MENLIATKCLNYLKLFQLTPAIHKWTMGNMKTPQEEVKQLLDEGYTQAELAKAAKVSQMTISRWFRGKVKKISATRMGRINAKFGKQKGSK